MRKLLFEAGRLLFSLAIIVSACGIFVRLKREDGPRRDPVAAAVQVEVGEGVEIEDGFEFDVDGEVVPYRDLNIAAEISGRVIFKSPQCRAGATVREGDVLFRIDPQEYQLEAARLEQFVEQAVGSREELGVDRESATEQIKLAEEELEIRKRELQRYTKKRAGGGSVFSQAEIDTARRNELQARNALQSRKDQLDMVASREKRLISGEQTARTQLERARLDLKRCEVRARISGVIVDESVQQEGYVQKGGVLIQIRDTSRMEVRCNLRMQQLQWLWEAASPSGGDPLGTSTPTRSLAGYQFPETTAKVLFELNGITYHWQGKLKRYANSGVDQRTRMIPCVCEVGAPDKVTRLDEKTWSPGAPPTLLNGMFVTVRIPAKLPRTILRLPVKAVTPGGDVWYVDEKMKLQRTRARVLHASDTSVLVERSPELVKAQIVVSPLVSPLPNMDARIHVAAESSDASAKEPLAADSDAEGTDKVEGEETKEAKAPPVAQEAKDAKDAISANAAKGTEGR